VKFLFNKKGETHIHKYSKWQDTEKGNIMHHLWNDRIVGFYIRQEHRCNECGKVELNLIQVKADDYKTLLKNNYNDQFDRIVRNLKTQE
jgi:hypothetical protein